VASFTDTVKIVVDVVTNQASSGLDSIKAKTAEAEGGFGKLKAGGSSAFSALGVGASTVAAGAGAAIAGFAVKAIGDFQSTAQEVLHFKEVAGGTAEAASRWVETFNDYGVSADTAGTLVGKLAKVTETSPASLEKFGASVIHAKDGTIDLNATLLNVIDTMHNAPDASTQAALGSAAFGKSWQDMAKVVDVGAAGIKQDFDSISGGQIFSEKDLKNSEDFRLALDDVSDAVAGVENAIGAEAIPVLTEFLTLMKEVAGAADLVPGPLAKIAETAAKFNPIALPYTAAKAALDALTGSTDSYVTAVGPMNSLTHQVAGSVADLAEQEKLDKAAKDDLAKSTKALNDFSEHTLKLFNDMQAAALASMDSDLAYKRAVEDTGKALQDFQAKQVAASDAVQKHGENSTEAATASDQLSSSSRTLEDSMYAVAASAAKSAEDQANAAGAAFNTGDKIDAEVGALNDLKAKFPELGGAIDGYIAKLNAIPHEKSTTVTADTSQATEAVAAFINATENKTAYIDVVGRLSTQGQAHAAGGPAGGLSLVGEQGPELVVLPNGSYVYTASQTRGMIRGYADGGFAGGGTDATGSNTLHALFGPGGRYYSTSDDPLRKLFGPGADFANWKLNSGKWAGWDMIHMFGPGSDFYRTGPDALTKLFGTGADFANMLTRDPNFKGMIGPRGGSTGGGAPTGGVEGMGALPGQYAGWAGVHTGGVPFVAAPAGGSQYNSSYYQDYGGFGAAAAAKTAADAAAKAGRIAALPSYYDTAPIHIENLTINMPIGANGDDIVQALKRYQRRNGAVPITTLS
jgi:hypothetical protein